ncbi:MAG: hypothetical protein AB2704_11970 [Candidatus Thiodiazotropha taylori]
MPHQIPLIKHRRADFIAARSGLEAGRDSEAVVSGGGVFGGC